MTLTKAQNALAEDGEPAEAEPIRVVSFSIIDTETQKPIKGYDKIAKNDTIAIMPPLKGG